MKAFFHKYLQNPKNEKGIQTNISQDNQRNERDLSQFLH